MADVRGIRWRLLAHAAMGLFLAAPPSAVAGAPERSDFLAWLAHTTDLKSSQVALIGVESVYSLEPLGSRLPTGEILVLVRTEPLADDWGAKHRFWSWDANLLIDCAQRRVRVVRSASYPQRNRGGSPTPEAQDYAAMTPLDHEPAAELVAAACDADFAWPLRDSSPPPPQVAELGPRGAPEARAAMAMIDPPLQAPSSTAPDPAARGWTLQLARGPSEDGAQRAVRMARKTLGPRAGGLASWTTTIPSAVGAPPEHAALLGGFASYVQASASCQTLRQAKQDCLVRRGEPEPSHAPRDSRPMQTPIEGGGDAAETTYAVQVARGPSEDGARRALVRARGTVGALADPARDHLPVSRVPGDHLRYEARLVGFSTAEAAGEVCRKLSSAGQDCFVLRPPEQLRQ